MPQPSPEFSQLMQRLKAGSEDAVREILDRYGDGLLRVIRRRLCRDLRSEFDSDDFYQAVWTSFFAHRHELSRFESPQDLEAFLKSMAGHKVIDQARRRLKSQSYSKNKEVDATVMEVCPPQAPDPTPSTVVAIRDEVESLTPNQRHMLELREQGWTLDQIASKFEVNEKTVRRFLKRFASRFENE